MVSDDLSQYAQNSHYSLTYGAVLFRPGGGDVCLYKSQLYKRKPVVTVFRPVARFTDSSTAQSLLNHLQEMQVWGNSQGTGQGDQALCVVCQLIAAELGLKSPPEPLFLDQIFDPFPTDHFPEALCDKTIFYERLELVSYAASLNGKNAHDWATCQQRLIATFQKCAELTDHTLNPVTPANESISPSISQTNQGAI